MAKYIADGQLYYVLRIMVNFEINQTFYIYRNDFLVDLQVFLSK